MTNNNELLKDLRKCLCNVKRGMEIVEQQLDAAFTTCTKIDVYPQNNLKIKDDDVEDVIHELADLVDKYGTETVPYCIGVINKYMKITNREIATMVETSNCSTCHGCVSTECKNANRAFPLVFSFDSKISTLKSWNTCTAHKCRYVQADPLNKPGVWNTGCGNHVYWNVDNDDCGTPPSHCPECGGKVIDD